MVRFVPCVFKPHPSPPRHQGGSVFPLSAHKGDGANCNGGGYMPFVSHCIGNQFGEMLSGQQ